MGKDKKSAGAGGASAGRRHADQQARAEARAHAQHAAEFNEQLRRLQLHYAQVEQSVLQQQQQQQQQQADAAATAAITAAAPAASQQARGQGHRQARRQPTSPDFLDMLHNYANNRTGGERRAWLDRHGLRGTSPRRQPVYSLLPAAMRDSHERRLEADRQALRLQQEAAAEVVRRYQVADASVDNDDKQSKGKDDDDDDGK